MSTLIKTYLFLGALALGALYWFTRKGNAAAVGVAVSQAAVSAAEGVVTGASESLLGIPQTDAEKCSLAMQNRDSLSASLYCDLATFLTYEKDSIFASDVVQSGAVNGSQNSTVVPVM